MAINESIDGEIENLKDNFRARNVAKQQEWMGLKHKPYCFRCAREDFNNMVEQAKSESMTRHGFLDINEVKKIDIKELDTYAKADRFELIKERVVKRGGGREERTPIRNPEPIHQWVQIGTGKILKHTGYYNHYKCKIRDCNLSVEIPLEEMDIKSKKQEIAIEA